MNNILDKLKMERNRSSTRANYYKIWSLFNRFLIQLDSIPRNWEHRVFLFLAHLVNHGRKSSTVKSYFSAIKSILWDGLYDLTVDSIQFRALVRACRQINDQIQPRFPIRLQLLNLILLELERMFEDQYYLKILYQTIIAIAYYGLFRIGEIIQGSHTILAKNVHLAQNKRKVMFILYTSKTHDTSSRPQKVKIAALNQNNLSCYCPFDLLTRYLTLRNNSYLTKDEHFFIFQGGIEITQLCLRNVLATALSNLGLNSSLYTFQALRAGRVTDLHKWGFTTEQIKIIGRWRSNTVYKIFKILAHYYSLV